MMKIFKKKLILLGLIFLVIPLVSSFDEQTFISCGGDSETIIGCLGDQELFFLGFDIINPQISIIYPTDNLVITNVVTALYGLNVNFSLTETNPGLCWYTIDGGITNITIPCLDGYNDFIITITDFGDLTIDIFVSDISGNENSTQVNISISRYTGPESGGGTTTDPSIRDTVDFKKYDRGTMCGKVSHFLSTYPNYTFENRQDLINELAIVFGFRVSEEVLEEYLENYEELCVEPKPEEPGEVPDKEDKNKYFWFWIVLSVLILLIVFIIIIISNRNEKEINVDKGPIKRFVEKIVREILGEEK